MIRLNVFLSLSFLLFIGPIIQLNLILTAAPLSSQQGEQPPLEKMKPSRSRNLEEALSETDTLVRLF